MPNKLSHKENPRGQIALREDFVFFLKRMKPLFLVPLNASKLDLSKTSEFLCITKEFHVAHPFLYKTFLKIRWFKARALIKLTTFTEADKICFKAGDKAFDANACRCRKQ